MMTNDPNAAREQRKQQILTVLRAIWKALTTRWGLKLLSVLLAVCLWGILISQDTTLPREKVFSNVKVNVINASALRQNGFVVVSGLEDLEPVRIKVSVPQKNFNTVSVGNYSVRADLSQITGTGEQTVKLSAISTNTALYGTVTDISTARIPVVVEDYATRTRIPVQIQAIGESPMGFFADKPTCDPMTVDIGGPKSIVDSVARCIAHYDMSELPAQEGTKRTTASFTFQDHAGNEIDSTKLTVSSQAVTLRDIIIDQTLYPTASVSISTENLITGQPAKGYRVTDISIEPESVRIAASDVSDYLDSDARLYLLSRVNIAGETQSITRAITISRPAAIVNMSSDIAYVTVTIEPIDAAKEEGGGV